MATTIAIAGVVATLASTGAGIAQSQGAFGGGDSSPKLPEPGKPDMSQIGKTLMPGAKADQAARTGGGFSPQLLEGIIGQQAGVPGQDLGILGEIQKSLGQGGGFQGP